MRIGIQQVIVFILIAAILGAASSAGTLTISDPSASLSVDGEERSIDLSGFEARFGRLPDGGFGVNFFGDGNLLLAAEALVDEEGVLLNVDGMSHSCRIDFNSLARMMTGVDPSALDVKALAEILKRGTEIRSTPNSVRVRIPYTTVNELLEELCPFLSQTLDSYDYDALTQALERFRAEDAGYTLEALLTDTLDSYDYNRRRRFSAVLGRNEGRSERHRHGDDARLRVRLAAARAGGQHQAAFRRAVGRVL